MSVQNEANINRRFILGAGLSYFQRLSDVNACRQRAPTSGLGLERS